MLNFGLRVKAKHLSLLQLKTISMQQPPPPSPLYDVGFGQMMDMLSSIQQEVNSISVKVEQCQIDIQKCLKHHHPSRDDED
jgi:hypothetical protein